MSDIMWTQKAKLDWIENFTTTPTLSFLMMESFPGTNILTSNFWIRIIFDLHDILNTLYLTYSWPPQPKWFGKSRKVQVIQRRRHIPIVLLRVNIVEYIWNKKNKEKSNQRQFFKDV